MKSHSVENLGDRTEELFLDDLDADHRYVEDLEEAARALEAYKAYLKAFRPPEDVVDTEAPTQELVVDDEVILDPAGFPLLTHKLKPDKSDILPESPVLPPAAEPRPTRPMTKKEIAQKKRSFKLTVYSAHRDSLPHVKSERKLADEVGERGVVFDGYNALFTHQRGPFQPHKRRGIHELVPKSLYLPYMRTVILAKSL